MVGLPDAAVRESRDRVRAAIRNSGFDFPQHRVTVNLAPADVRKAGAAFDLPIALGVLAATGIVTTRAIDRCAARSASSRSTDRCTRRAASCRSRPARGAMAAARCCCPRPTPPRRSIVDGLRVLPVRLPAGSRRRLERHAVEPRAVVRAAPRDGDRPTTSRSGGRAGTGDSDVARSKSPRPAATTCCCVGPPGAGKTMLARRLPGLLPPLTLRRGAGGDDRSTRWRDCCRRARPRHACGRFARRITRCRTPRWSAAARCRGPARSASRITGCCSWTRCRSSRDAPWRCLRQPIEHGDRDDRAGGAHQHVFPSAFMLVAAMNPCPCGLLRRSAPRVPLCTGRWCSATAGRLSGPLGIASISSCRSPPCLRRDLARVESGEPSAEVRARVLAARNRQAERQRDRLNARLARASAAAPIST